MRIQLKAALFLAGLLLFTMSLFSILVLHGIKENYQNQTQGMLYQQSKAANLFLKHTYTQNQLNSPEKVLFSEVFIHQLSYMSKMRVMIYDQKEEQIADSMVTNSQIIAPDLTRVAKKGKIAYKIVGNQLIYVAPLYGIDQQIGMIQFIYSLQSYLQFYSSIEHLFIRVGFSIFFISFIISYLYSKSLTNAISKLKIMAERISKGIYLHTPLKRKDELGKLSHQIVDMGNTIAQNIDHLKDEQKKLEHALRQVKMLESKQKIFINSVTHELKTPLTVIHTYVDLMDMYQDDEELLKDARYHLKQESERLHGMVERVLQLASIEKYEFSMRAELVELDIILLEQCRRMSQKAQKYQVSIEHNIEKSLYVWVDQEIVIRIFLNLIDNAIKYNRPNGKVEVSTKQEDGKIRIFIKDTGIGIPSEQWERVFEPFYIVHEERSKETGGSGLGLSLVKEWVTQQRGTIEILESSDQGTCFLLTFPRFDLDHEHIHLTKEDRN
ncbi:Signal transduction histidine kinase [Seinonella peptonophila]|uniref:histidine kinase n=1 Tax=Seinonella peptonophila TaxID=112248 RepID=A0A1M4X123_9BACL|nr:ATP-binding protein [Seinonella peptonophila]SHE87077.1 Signal transduction histidine kinase [Seinonella peptonophila]